MLGSDNKKSPNLMGYLLCRNIRSKNYSDEKWQETTVKIMSLFLIIISSQNKILI